ncbi:MAG TPA: glycogen synthase GlgA [Dehalococcoidales bacterium]|nr:glycogen synthase GlgA [Dehalococcoidales bacterium]
MAGNQPQAPIHIVMASSEISPFGQTGGLGDVLGSLPVALEQLGLKISLIMPAYRTVLKRKFELEDTGISLSVPVSNRTEHGTVLKGTIGKSIPVYFVRADKYFDREELYSHDGIDFPDNAERFTFFSRAVLELCKHFSPDILHANDWETALSITFLKTQRGLYPELHHTRTVLTIHNLGYQGIFWKPDWHILNLEWRFFTSEYLEFYGKINFLKAGIVFADRVTTVSPSYAQEIQTQEFGFGLDGVLRARAKSLTGILNRIDYHEWNPAIDNKIKQTYSTDDLTGKARCKSELQKFFHLPSSPETPIIGWVSRLVSQKGCDLLQQVLPELLTKNIQFVLLGDGDTQYSDIFKQLPSAYPNKAGVHIGYDDALMRNIVAGSDFLLLPSRYEPCGLTQLYGLRYGTPSVVRATGGLKDSIHEFHPESGTGTGFLFEKYEAKEFEAAISRALSCYEQKNNWNSIIKNAMKTDVSWKKSAHVYKELYTNLLSQPAEPTN